MNDLSFEIVWQDDFCQELKISAVSDYCSAWQNIYVDEALLNRVSNEIVKYVANWQSPKYIRIGVTGGNHSPAFSMKLLPTDRLGHIAIEFDFELADILDGSHHAVFFIKSELGQLEKFGKATLSLAQGTIGDVIRL